MSILSTFQKPVLILVLFLYFPFFTTSKATSKTEIDSLLKVLSQSVNDTNKVWVLRDLAYYHLEENLDSALLYSEKGFKLSTELNFAQGQIWTLYQKALALEFKDDFEKSTETYQFIIDLATFHKDTLSMAKLNNALGAAYYYQSDFGKAIAHYLEALDMSEHVDYNQGAAHALNNLGVIYRHRRDYKKAMEIYNRSLNIKTALNDSIGIVNSHYNLGLLYSYCNEYEESLSQFSKARYLSDLFSASKKSNHTMPEINIGLGIAYYNLGEFHESEKHLKSGLSNLGSDKVAEKVSAYAYLGMLEIKSGKSKTGLEKLLTAQALVKNSERLELKRQVAKELALAYELLNQPTAALDSWKLFNTYNDSINAEQKIWAFEEMQAKFEAIEKDKTILLQQSVIQSEKTRKNKNLLVFSALFVIVFIAGYHWFKKLDLRHIHQIQLAHKKAETFKLKNGHKLEFLGNSKKIHALLTKREKEIILLVEQGRTNQEIAQELFVSENTIKTHLKNIYSKTDAHNRTDLIHKLRMG